ncbi:MAG: PAS domain-containing protein, partial [bacterium]
EVLYADDEQFEKIHQQTIEQGSFTGEVLNETKEGEVFPAYLSASVLEDEEGNLRGVMGVSRDITEEKKRERELELKERALASVSEGLIITDPSLEDNPVIYCNDGFTRITGYDEQEILGKNCRFLQGEDTDEQTVREIRRAINNEEPIRTEILNYRKDGTPFWNHLSITPVRNAEGQLTHYVGVQEDITDRVERQHELERYERIQENLPVGVFRTKPDGTIVDVNSTVVEIMNADSEEELKQHNLNEIYADSQRRDELVDRVSEEDVVENVEVETNTLDGRTKWMSLKMRKVEENNQSYLDGVVQDITERKKAEQALRERTRKLEQSNRQLKQFANIAAHDLKQPLRTITSFAELIESRYGEQFDKQLGRYLNRIKNGTRKMKELLDGLMDYSKVGTGDTSFTSVDLNDVIDDVREDLRIKLNETGGEITAENLPEIKGEPVLLRQLFQNVIDNSLTYRSDEPPRIEITSEKRESGEVVITVRDNGMGMEPEYTDQIFDVFKRLQPDSEVSGRGIGLSICRRIVEEHGGSISADSTPGEGTAIQMTFPREGM